MITISEWNQKRQSAGRLRQPTNPINYDILLTIIRRPCCSFYEQLILKQLHVYPSCGRYLIAATLKASMMLPYRTRFLFLSILIRNVRKKMKCRMMIIVIGGRSDKSGKNEAVVCLRSCIPIMHCWNQWWWS